MFRFNKLMCISQYFNFSAIFFDLESGLPVTVIVTAGHTQRYLFNIVTYSFTLKGIKSQILLELKEIKQTPQASPVVYSESCSICTTKDGSVEYVMALCQRPSWKGGIDHGLVPHSSEASWVILSFPLTPCTFIAPMEFI